MPSCAASSAHAYTAGSLATAAAVLTLTLFDIAPEALSLPPLDDDSPQQLAGVYSGSGADEASPGSEGGVDHPAQSYGRVVGGLAIIMPPGEQAASTNTFPVGTRFSVDPEHSLQVGLVGKIVANFTPSSEVEWTAASPSLIEVKVERGIAAVRYDRRPSDPVLQTRTPSAVVRVIGTVFTVQVADSDNTEVSVLRGQVEVLHPKTNRLLAEEIYRGRALIALARGQTQGAQATAEKTIALCRDLGLAIDEGMSLRVLGQVLMAAQQHVPVQGAFAQSLALTKADVYEAARPQLEWARALFATDRAQAMTLLQDACATFERLGAQRDRQACTQFLNG